MDGTLKIMLIALGVVASLVGLVVTYGAPAWVDRKGLAEKKAVDPHLLENLPEEEVAKYKRNAAILDIKIKGLCIAIPGMVAIVLVLR